MRIKLSIILVFCACFVYGQRDSLKGKKSPAYAKSDEIKELGSDSLSSNKFSIEIPPLSYIDPYSLASYQVTIEMQLYQNLSLCLEGGGYFKNGGILDDDGRTSGAKGYMAKAEIKAYANSKHIANGGYISIEGVYKNQSYNWQDSIHIAPAYLTTFRVYKSIYCFNLKFGDAKIYKSGFIFDWYFGLGVRFRNVNTSLTPQQVGALKYDDDSNYDSPILGQETLPDHRTYVNPVLGFKVGYCIR